MQPAWNLFRVFDDQAVLTLCRAYEEVRVTLPSYAPECVATAVLVAAENGELELERLRSAAIAFCQDTR
jgi:hypothetical protein